MVSTISTAAKTFGVSKSISTAPPTEKDLALTAALIEELKAFGSYEPIPETHKRVEVLTDLNTIVKEWMKEIALKRIGTAISPGGKLMAFGSYRLGVHSSGGDIDSVILAPRYITRVDFFSSLKNILLANPKVKNLNAIEKAFVPLITMEYDGIEVDLLFARLNMNTVPENLDLTDDNLLKNLDQEDVRSLNGIRVAEALLKFVPNHESFCTTLRAIKIWAKSHGIYSNAMGFFGGITWAILVARACQLYPNASPSRLIQKVFFVFATWNWKSPVILNFLNTEREEMGNLNFLVWGQNHTDKFHLMPILTPAFPEQNSTHNVSKSTMEVIQKEMEEALRICDAIHNGKATWKDLLEPMNFFSRYKNFLAIKMESGADSGFESFLESKMRQLVTILERNPAVRIAHICPKMYKSNRNESVWFFGLEFTVNVKMLDLTKDIEQFKKSVKKQASNQKMEKILDVDITFTKRVELIKILPVAELKKGRSYEAKTTTSEVENKENFGGRKRSNGGDFENFEAPIAKRAVLQAVY